jgi:anaerobic magnesium-protoporphyrin IX monomethyl ester cyclase
MMITTPIRPTPTNFPPIGSLSMISYLRRSGIDDIEFYHIDGNRPTFDDAVAHIVERGPDVLGISSVVSTAYEYTKKISQAVKTALPETLIVVGGNLAASAEVLLRYTGVDLCVIGEGEKCLLDIVRRAEQTRIPSEFGDIPGLAYMDGTQFQTTGFVTALDRSEIYEIDWSILDDATDMGIYFTEVAPGSVGWSKFMHDSRAHEPARIGKNFALIPAAKGCVAKCTFCHRFDKGIRYIPPDDFIRRLKISIEKYNIGFVAVADENFGTDQRWLREFCEKIKSLDILWRVAGMRVNCVSPEILKLMRESGCVAILYGMETGSPKMLEVMEKKTKQEDNINAMQWTLDAGLTTVVQLVIGMPGESPQTIRETIDFTKWANSLRKDQSPNDLSINYAQALPGTPLYEFARHRGMIAAGREGEEEYLLRISDKDAHDEVTTLNFTDYPKLITEVWRPRITIETNHAYVRKFGIEHYMSVTLFNSDFFSWPSDDEGYFANPKRLVDTSVATSTLNEEIDIIALKKPGIAPPLLRLIKERRLGVAMICYPRTAYFFRHFLIFLVLFKNLTRNGAGYTWGLIKEYFRYRFRKISAFGSTKTAPRSLRKVVNDLGVLGDDSPEMAVLRKGR